jgi:hypothetical protein
MRGIVVGLLVGIVAAGGVIYLTLGTSDDTPDTAAGVYERTVLRHAERVLAEATAPEEVCADARAARSAVNSKYPSGLIAVSIDAVYHEVVSLCEERGLWGGR